MISFTNLIAVTVCTGLITACQSTAVGPGGTSQKETLLVQSGFSAFTVTTPKQQQHVAKLPAGKVSGVMYKGKKYYVYPSGKDRLMVGSQSDYNRYRQALQAQALMATPDFEEETHGPHPVLIQEFDGFGPLGE